MGYVDHEAGGPGVRSWSCESGATAVEYALVASLIAGVIAAAVALIGPALVPVFQSVAAAL